MLPIIICDDDQFTLRLLSSLLQKAVQDSGVDAKIVCLASNVQELLQFIKGKNGFLYFLDYDLGQKSLNGIDLVKQIYRKDQLGKIVFVTSHAEKGMDILRSGIRPFGFIEKSIDQDRMVKEYTRYLKMAVGEESGVEPEKEIELPIGIGEIVRLPISEITYVDSVKSIAHAICYHTFDESEITVRDTIERAKELLGKDFIRSHRSVLVNRNHIVALRDGEIRLSNGASVVCAIGRRKAILKECFSEREGTKND